MIGPSNRIWLLLSLVGLLIGYADAQQAPPTGAQNPYMVGSEGYPSPLGRGVGGEGAHPQAYLITSQNSPTTQTKPRVNSTVLR